MTFDLTKIDDFFPFKEYRPDQKRDIERILSAFNNGKATVIAEMPTGSGKSAIAYTIAQYFDKVYYLTPSKFLQSQLITDFGENGKFVKTAPMIDLKGRNAYDCNYWYRMTHDCQDQIPDGKQMEYMVMANKGAATDNGYCKRHGNLSKDKFCFPSHYNGYTNIFNEYDDPKYKELYGFYSYCPYWDRRAEALNNKICLMNFSSFLYQTKVVKSFHKRSLLICDEAHNISQALMSFVEFGISDKYFRQQEIQFPEFETAEEYFEFFEEVRLKAVMTDLYNLARISDDIKDEEFWHSMLMKYDIFAASALSGNWVVQYEQNKADDDIVISSKITLKPIFVDKYATDYVFSMADKVLLMSATILDPVSMSKDLGIEQNTVYSFRTKSRFPKENRPIYFKPCGSLSYKNKRDTFPKLVKAVDEICNEFPNDKGIIHTHTFEIAKLLMSECENRDRFLFQEEFSTKEEMLEEHDKLTNSVIVAPALHEGIDMIDTRARYSIICKTPFPSMADPQIKARMELSHKYLDYLATLKIVQSAGRIIRHDKDWGTTYILDSDFEVFSKRAKKMFPEWFAEALIMPKEKYATPNLRG